MHVRGTHGNTGKKSFLQRVFPWGVKRKAMLPVSVAVTVIGAGAVTYTGYKVLLHIALPVLFSREDTSKHILTIFEEGGRPKWKAEAAQTLKKSTVNRPEILHQLTEILYPTKVSTYAIITGAVGTGKTNAVMQAIMAKGGSKDAPNGAVYYEVPVSESPKDVLKHFARQFGIEEDPVTLMDAAKIRYFGKTQEVNPSRTDVFLRVEDELRECARQFKRKHHRPITVAIDGCEILAKKDPGLLELFQGFARRSANEGNIQFVFIASDYLVVTTMLSPSDGSRADEVYEVGDVTDEDAIAILKCRIQEENAEKEKDLSDDDIDSFARAIVTKYTGGRLLILAAVKLHMDGKTVDEVVNELVNYEYNIVEKSLLNLAISPTHDAFKQLLVKGEAGVDYAELRSLGLSKKQINKLTTANILSINDEIQYTFHSRYHVTMFSNIFGTAET